MVARKNHAKQLAHNRELRDLDHARQSVGAAVDTIAAAIPAVRHYAGYVWAASRARKEQAKAAAETDEIEGIVRDGDDLLDTREPEQVEALGVDQLRWENDVLATERDAAREHTKKLEEAYGARPEADAMLSRLLADGLQS
jgi:hypothetical protein